MTHALRNSRNCRKNARARRRSVWAALATAAALTALSTVGAGCGSEGIVGGDCAPSYTVCDLTCVDLARDLSNCGACGVACPAGGACTAGACNAQADRDAGSGDASRDATPDGSTLDGSRDGEASVTDGSPSDGSTVDGTTPDAATLDGSAGDSDVGDACTPPYNTPQRCGSCTKACSGATPVCFSDDGIFYCAAICPSNRALCGGACVDTAKDPLHCSACGNVCASALCVASVCTGAAPKGHIVTIGHAYGGVASNTSQARVLANAAFLSTRNPLRVLSYDEYASTTAASNVQTIVTQAGASLGRVVSFTALGSSNDLPQRLTRAEVDVLVVHDQQNAPVGGLATIGATFSPTLSTFVLNGGVVIVLDGMAGTTREMNLFLTSSTLLVVPTHHALAVATPLTVVDPLSSVGSGVVSPYGASTDSASYTSPETQGLNTATIVVDQASHEPVVVHKAVF